MAQLSRTKKYQQLRAQIDEDTTAAQAQPVKPQPRLSRVQNHSLSHATKPLHSHEEELTNQNKTSDFQTSPVMDELLGEVKQYNIDNGTRITDDTQINILRQLDAPQEPKKRTEHFLPMDEDDSDEGGTTMKLPKGIKEEPAMAAAMPSQKLTRINPIRISEEEEEVIEAPQTTEKIVLSSNDIRADEHADTDQLSVLTTHRDVEVETEKPAASSRPAKKKKKKKTVTKKSTRPVKKEKIETVDEMPSAKMRMRAEDFENDLPEKAKKKSNTLLNVILIILIILLIASIGLTIYFVKEMGVL